MFLETFDVKHLDFTGDICKRPNYYYPITFDPLILIGNTMMFWPLYVRMH
jgi:hypothetical protein